MSIIFQTLSKLQTTAPVDPSQPSLEAVRQGAVGSSANRVKRSLWIAAIVAGVFLVMGLAVIAGMTFLVGHLDRSNGQRSGHPQMTPDASVSVAAEQPTRAIAATRIAPRYIPPEDMPRSSVLGSADPTPPPTAIGTTLQTSSIAAMSHDSGETMQAQPEAASEGHALVAEPRALAEPNRSATGKDEASQQGRIKEDAREKLAVTSEALNTERLKMLQAHSAIMQKNERIGRLVNEIESALSGPTQDNERIVTLLEQLGRLKEPGSPYVKKLRAYWLLKEEKYDQAKTILNQLAAIDPEDTEVGINLAVVDLRTGNAPAALQRLQRLKRAHPDNARINDLVRKLQ